MIGKKFLCAGLSALLLTGLLAGCGAPAEPVSDSSDIAFQTAGITRDTVLLTIDGTEVTADEYLFWLQSIISEASGNSQLPEGEDWTTAEIDGVPAVEYLKTQALETSKVFTVIANQAAKEDVTLSQEDQDSLQAQLDQFEAQLPLYYPGMTLQDWLDGQCVSLETFQRLNGIQLLAQNLQDALVEYGALSITDEDLDGLVTELMGETYKVKHILLAFPEKEADNQVTDEEKAAVKAEADTLLAQIRAAGDPYAEFDQVMNERSEDGRDADGNLNAPDGYLAYSGQMVPPFEEASLALEPGAFSEPVETTYGYHLILRLEMTDEDRQELREMVRPYQVNLRMTELNERWMDEAVVETTQAYQDLDPKAFYDKLTQLNEAREAERAAANATPTPSPEIQADDPAASGAVG